MGNKGQETIISFLGDNGKLFDRFVKAGLPADFVFHIGHEIIKTQSELTAKTDTIAELNAENARLQVFIGELKEALLEQMNETIILAKFHDDTLRSRIRSTDLQPPEYYDWQATAESGELLERLL